MKKFLLAAFLLVALAQLYVPAKMILGREEILREGKEFKFKTAPIDPNDPFRGKYITLNYDQNRFHIRDTAEVWNNGEEVFVVLEENSEGFATITDVQKEKPGDDTYYVKASLWSVAENSLIIRYPFERFYMEEYKAPDAELVYRESLIDSTQVTYAVVKIKNGEAVIKDVLIDEQSIIDIVLENQ